MINKNIPEDKSRLIQQVGEYIASQSGSELDEIKNIGSIIYSGSIYYKFKITDITPIQRLISKLNSRKGENNLSAEFSLGGTEVLGGEPISVSYWVQLPNESEDDNARDKIIGFLENILEKAGTPEGQLD